jgi:hypothetical protein
MTKEQILASYLVLEDKQRDIIKMLIDEIISRDQKIVDLEKSLNDNK